MFKFRRVAFSGRKSLMKYEKDSKTKKKKDECLLEKEVEKYKQECSLCKWIISKIQVFFERLKIIKYAKGG